MVRADAIRTKRSAARVFASRPSGRVTVGLAAIAVLTRLVLADLSALDLAVVVVGLLLVGPVEWFAHRSFLHAEPASWARRRLGTGRGHQEHHIDPSDLDWLLLGRGDAIAFAAAVALVALTWAAPIALLAGAAPLMVTAIAVGWLALAHYEWTHLLVHSRYRPRTRYYARRARHHRLHHYRNEEHWLGVTSGLGDRLFRTLPADRTSVPLSPTARTLGVADGDRLA